MEEQAVKDFLTDMTRLAKKHGIELSACSCCDGIHLDKLKGSKGEYTVEYDKSEGGWLWFGWTGGRDEDEL